MKERPILFNDEMVRAILEGRKTQTRRILDLPAGWSFKTSNERSCILGEITSPHPKKNRFGAFIRKEVFQGSGKFQHDIVTCKYGEPGDRLWVRETWATRPLYDDLPPRDIPTGSKVYYPATPELGLLNCEKHRPSIHMPRWASRIALEITDVRVERLQDISDQDAIAEGAQNFPELPGKSRWGQDNRWSMQDPDSVDQCLGSARMAFANYFCRISGKTRKGLIDFTPWDSNPWVWVIEFRRIEEREQAA